MTLQRVVELWLNSGAYLIGVRAIARRFPNATFSQFLAACAYQRGGWTDVALRKAWEGGRP